MQTKRPIASGAEEILGGYFPVLDHGFVALVDYMGTDDDIERAARVSYGAGTRRVSQTRGLVRYLQRHAHTTPSEMVEFKFHCSMPMFVARQWVRHRTASVNEYSARYSLLPLLFYEPPHAHFAHQSSVNNQGREAEPASPELYAAAVERWQQLRDHASDTYGWLLGEDVAREIARIDLPLSTYTQWYWKIDLHNLLHFLTLRVDDHAQWEIQEYGRVMAGMLERVAPLAYEAWLDYNVLGTRLSYGERQALARLVRPDGDGIAVRDGVSELGGTELRELGLAPREIRELLAKIEAPTRPDFSLDLGDMRSAEEMEKKMLVAVPEPDRPLRESIANIYRQANEFADEAGGIEFGMNILYGPPISQPDVMIVSAQGGGPDRHRQRSWPDRLLYLDSDYQFGRRLVSDFDHAGLSNVLRNATVATNIAFPQFQGFDKWLKRDGSEEWLNRSLAWVHQLAELMPPKVVLTYGSHAFRHLVGRKKLPGIDKDEWLGIPVVGCGHLMQGSTKDERNRALKLVKGHLEQGGV